MAEHGAFKMPGKNLSLEPTTRLSQLENEPGYRIFTECTRGGYRGVLYRKNLVKGTRIRVDLFNGFPFWKVRELLRCRNGGVGMTERQRNIKLAMEKSMGGRSWLVCDGKYWAVNTKPEENICGFSKGFVIEQCYIDGVEQMPVEVMKVETKKQAYEQILEEYHRNAVSMGEIIAQFSIVGLSVEAVVDVYAQLIREADGDTLEVNGEEYNGYRRGFNE